jgi:gliding motility-associated-like protein
MLNRSQGADTYLWKFGDGRTSTAVNPGHRFSQSGDKEITLIAYKSNAPGIVCVDSIVRTVSITDSVNINFNYSDSIANCAPLTVTFKNLYPGNTFAAWDFGDGRRQNGDSVSNTYTIPGNYLVTLNVKTTNGCNYYGSKPIVIRSPFGTVRYKSNYSCIDETLRFEALPENTDSIRWNFGDGTTFTTTERVVFYKYKLPGTYLPKVEFVSSAGCSYLPPIRDSIRIDRVNAGFKSVREEICGSTKVIFTDTSTTYFPRSTIRWNFGDGTVGNNAIQEINYRSSNTFIITNIVTSVSGCSDTAVTILPVFVKGIPSAQVIGDTAGCTNRSVRLESKILSSDSISLIRWRTAQNTDVYGSIFTAQYGVSGSYPMTLIVGTKFGCYDTVSVPLTVYTAPNVVASADVTICSGSSIELNATGADRYSWFPIQDISCVNCQKTIAKPQQSTIFSVRGESINGCFDLDTVLVTVIPKFKMKATPSDSICIGDSIQLVVSGAASYKWTPSSTLSGDTIQNPIAKPERTTTYRIVGSDEYGCFKDTAFITIGVGNYPTLNLGEDLLLATGALFTVKPTFTEGPMKSWKWTPAKDLNCVDCPNPTIRARNGITYVAQATNFFGCSATDSITVRVFCENSQVFIPNAFTPDNDGINDLFIVRASGIQSVKSLKIFNRWGQMVFDRANFEPNDPKNAWDGRVNGIVGGPDVYVYIIEVICDDGTPYFYKGNVSILK